jgi:hypothetical protein
VPGIDTWNGGSSSGPDDYLPAVRFNTTGTAQQINSSLTMPAGPVVVHPSSSQLVVVGWTSPVSGAIRISGGVQDIDAGGGDGISWLIEQGSSTWPAARSATVASRTSRTAAVAAH